MENAFLDLLHSGTDGILMSILLENLQLDEERSLFAPESREQDGMETIIIQKYGKMGQCTFPVIEKLNDRKRIEMNMFI